MPPRQVQEMIFECNRKREGRRAMEATMQRAGVDGLLDQKKRSSCEQQQAGTSVQVSVGLPAVVSWESLSRIAPVQQKAEGELSFGICIHRVSAEGDTRGRQGGSLGSGDLGEENVVTRERTQWPPCELGQR
eukprot:GGOE01004017.1.p2 GENE.GGOE01004017.1~~GGOE01004017.1.p2  ORF type:complete len:132 (+),score=6.58 GGOE01004017.1:136-531(+)